MFGGVLGVGRWAVGMAGFKLSILGFFRHLAGGIGGTSGSWVILSIASW